MRRGCLWLFLIFLGLGTLSRIINGPSHSDGSINQPTLPGSADASLADNASSSAPNLSENRAEAKEPASTNSEEDRPMVAGADGQSYAEATAGINRMWSIYHAWGTALKQCEDSVLDHIPMNTPRQKAIEDTEIRCENIAAQLPDMIKRGGFAPKDSDYMTKGKLRQLIEDEINQKFGA